MSEVAAASRHKEFLGEILHWVGDKPYKKFRALPYLVFESSVLKHLQSKR